MSNRRTGWIGVDFDGTLATYEGPWSHEKLGEPIPLMVDRVKRWLKDGQEVRIFTARISHDGTTQQMMWAEQSVGLIKEWCQKVFDTQLAVTNVKDYEMLCIYDDRAVAVETNTGEVLGGREF